MRHGYAVKKDGTGWRAVTEDMIDSETETFQVEQPELIQTPQHSELVTKIQLILAFKQLEMLEQFQLWMRAQSATLQMLFDAATTLKIDAPIVQYAKTGLGMTDEQLVELFDIANEIDVNALPPNAFGV